MSHGNRILKVNGMGEVPTDHASIKIFRLLGNLPMILHSDPRQVLVIAFGGGITLNSVLLHQPERVDCVEVVPGVVEAADFFARYNNYVFNRGGYGSPPTNPRRRQKPRDADTRALRYHYRRCDPSRYGG